MSDSHHTDHSPIVLDEGLFTPRIKDPVVNIEYITQLTYFQGCVIYPKHKSSLISVTLHSTL